MNDLLIHFGVGEEVRNKLFEKKEEVLKLMFEDTIFDNTKPVEQTECFEYARILIPLNQNPKMTILIWERLCKDVK